MSSLISVQNLSFAYQDKLVLKQVSLSLKKGEGVYLKGENGSGKSTLIKILASLLQAPRGEIKKSHDCRLAVFLSPAALYEELRVIENLKFFQRIHSLSQQKLEELIRDFNLSSFLDQFVSQISFGQRARVCLSTVLMSSADLYFLDEAFLGLDQSSVKFLQSFLLSLKKQDKSYLLTSHQESLVSHITDRSLELKEGRLLS